MCGSCKTLSFKTLAFTIDRNIAPINVIARVNAVGLEMVHSFIHNVFPMSRKSFNRPPSAEPDPDAKLMIEVVAGSEQAFIELVRNHQRGLLNFFVRMGVNHYSEDLVQETFVRLYRYRKRYRPVAKFKTFLYVLARHVWIDHCRKQARDRRLADCLLTDVQIDERAPGKRRSGERLDIQAALDKLSPKLRETLVLNVYQGLPYQEIADVLGIRLGTVKSRINLALKAMRSFLGEA